MVHAIEFHGRLCRAAGPPADPGLYDLQFRLHPGPADEAILWEDEIRAIPVLSGGYYHVILGSGNALPGHLFDGAPRYLSVRVLRGGADMEEVSERVPLLGLLLKLGDDLGGVEERVAALEAAQRDTRTTRRRVRLLRRRMVNLEAGEGGLLSLGSRIAAMEVRLVRVDGEAGRVSRLEDEMEDLVGQDGDVVDLDARLCRLEGVSTPGEHDRLAVLERRLADVEARLKRR